MMQLAVVSGRGHTDPPVFIPWWIFFTAVTVVYNSWDWSSCLIGIGIIAQVQLLFLAIEDVKGKTFQEYIDTIHPDTSAPHLPDCRKFHPAAWFRSLIQPYLSFIVVCWKFGRKIGMATLFFLTAARHFEGRETEANWFEREKTVKKMRKDVSDLDPEVRPHWIAEVKKMLDGLLKTANSLRTTVSTSGCLLFQDIAKEYGSEIDGMVEILLQNFIKLCANTKQITRANANDTVLAIIAHVSYHIRIVQHIHNACQDKNVHPRLFACEWLKKIIKRHSASVIESHGGVDLIEKSIKLGLEDRDKNVREAMRPTYWNFARRWPVRSEGLFNSLDKTKQEQLLADPSNPNPAPSVTVSKAIPAVSVSRSTIAPSKAVSNDLEAQPLAQKPTLKEIKVALRKAENKEEPKSQTEKPTLKEIKATLKMAQNTRNITAVLVSDNKAGAAVAQNVTQASDQEPKRTISAAPLRRKKTTTAIPSQSQHTVPDEEPLPMHTLLDNEAQGSGAQAEAPESEAAVPSPTDKETTNIKHVESLLNPIAPPFAPSTPQMTPRIAEEMTLRASQQMTPRTYRAMTPRAASLQMTPRTYEEMTPRASEVDRQSQKRQTEVNMAVKKFETRDYCIHDIRILHDRLNEESYYPDWQALIEPLCTWLESPKMPTESTKVLYWEEQQYYVLSTLRILLGNKIWAECYYPRILTALTTANKWYKKQGHMIIGIRKALNFLINHCNVIECIESLCESMEYKGEYKREVDLEEIHLMAMGAMLHRIHTHPEDEAELYRQLGAEGLTMHRIGAFGASALASGVASIRLAAMKFAIEFWHVAPEECYYEIMGGDEKTESILRYYINRHKKIDDHVSMIA